MYKCEERKKTHLCAEFCNLNTKTKTDAEPLPKIDAVLDKLAQAKVFFAVDLVREY